MDQAAAQQAQAERMANIEQRISVLNEKAHIHPSGASRGHDQGLTLNPAAPDGILGIDVVEYWSCVYALLLITGGIIGYKKAGSMASLYAGVRRFNVIEFNERQRG